jgi:hypothetical protein
VAIAYLIWRLQIVVQCQYSALSLPQTPTMLKDVEILAIEDCFAKIRHFGFGNVLLGNALIDSDFHSVLGFFTCERLQR